MRLFPLSLRIFYLKTRLHRAVPRRFPPIFPRPLGAEPPLWAQWAFRRALQDGQPEASARRVGAGGASSRGEGEVLGLKGSVGILRCSEQGGGQV